MRVIPVATVLVAIIAGMKALYWFRASSMRTLALRLGFRYTKGDFSLLIPPKDHSRIPTSFRLRGYPVNTVRRTWNVIEGEVNGISIVVLDSIWGIGRGQYCTFIAARTDQNPFVDISPKEKIAQSNGWTAIYRLRFLQLPWTLSAERIEDHIRRIKSL